MFRRVGGRFRLCLRLRVSLAFCLFDDARCFGCILDIDTMLKD
jgi:hypothetical protein